MRAWPSGVVALLLALPVPGFAATITPLLGARVEAATPDEAIPVLVFLSDEAPLGQFRSGRASAAPMIRALHDKAESTQPALRQFLADVGYRGRVESFWIVNAIAIDATPSLLEALTSRPEVATLDFDAPGEAVDETQRGAVVGNPAWNIQKIRADLVWTTLGLDGTGVVIGSMDTGFDPLHATLAGKWRGGTNSWRDVVLVKTSPYDDHFHGTATIAAMVGGDGDGPLDPDIGVAYGAKFIAVKVLDFLGHTTLTRLFSGAQWILDPDSNPETNDFPNIVNNSWMIDSGSTAFYGAAQAWRAAGIIPVFCIGNSGPGASTTRPPANYNNVIGVGGTNSTDGYYTFTSWGPSPGGSTFPSDLRKPDLSAPGEQVLSALPGGLYQTGSGTSFAAPQVAGTIALMLQKHPGLTYDEVLATLKATAVDLGNVGYDDIFGYGRIDAFAAVQSTVGVSSSTPSGVRFTVGPNPFSGSVRMQWDVSRSPVQVRIFDVGGRVVRTIPVAGTQSASWDGCNESGARAKAGVYLARLEPEGVARRIVVLR